VNDYNETAVLAAIKAATGADNVVVERTEYKIAVSYNFSSLDPPPNQSQAEEAIAEALSIPVSQVTVTVTVGRRLGATPRRLSSSWDAQITTENAVAAKGVQTASQDSAALSATLSNTMGKDVTVPASAVSAPKTEITLVTTVVVPGTRTVDEVDAAVKGNELTTQMNAAVGSVATFSAPTTVLSTLAPTVALTTATPTVAPTATPTVAPTTATPTATPTANPTVAPTGATGGTVNTTKPAPPTPESDSSQWLTAQVFALLVVAAVGVHM
jgi:hypothetical protein